MTIKSHMDPGLNIKAGSRVMAVIRRRSCTLKQLAEAADVSLHTASRWMRGLQEVGAVRPTVPQRLDGQLGVVPIVWEWVP